MCAVCLSVCVQVEQDYRALGPQVGVALDSVSTETARAAIAVAVGDAVKERERTQQKVCLVSQRPCHVGVLQHGLLYSCSYQK